MLLVHDALDILDHHDGVVDHDTDGQNQTQQGHHVEREPEGQHDAEGADERDGYGDDRNQGGPPVLQREEHHQNHQHECLDERVIYLADGLRNIGGHVERNLVGDAFGKVAADLFHLFLDRFGHLHGISTGQHVDIQHGCIAAVDTALGIVRLGFERDASHVAQPYQRAVGVGPDNNLFKLGYRRQPPLGNDRGCHVDVADGLLSQHAGRRFAVLVFQGLLQIFDRESEVGQTVGLYPYLHGIVTAAHVRHATHTLDTAQHIYHVEGGIVAQVDFVEFGVARPQRDGHQSARSLFLHRDTVLHHLGRQTGFGLFHSVLYLDGRQVGVGRNVEGDGGREATRVAVGRLHVEHAGSSVQLLFDRGGHSLGNGLSTRTRVGGRHFYHRRNNLRILVDGEEDKSQHTDNHNHD